MRSGQRHKSRPLWSTATEELRPDGEPADTGSVESDLRNWLERYLGEMGSKVGPTASTRAKAVMDGVMAPIIYRTLFGPAPMMQQGAHMLLEACMKGAARRRKKAAAPA